MTDDQELKLQCFELVLKAPSPSFGDVLENAKVLLKWLAASPNPEAKASKEALQ